MKTKEIVTPMLYHQVDERWPAFSCKDYNDYLEKYLVKASFHEGVPNDVKESFEVVEYIIAHSWYHYPMYDEALNKTLRTFELAIKKKCVLLSIPIDQLNPKKNVFENRPLAHLIKEICVHEPNKRQSIFLEHLKNLRNSLMHPKEHSYSGGISFGMILLSVNIINTLFAPESKMVFLEELRTERQKQVSLLTGKAMDAISNKQGLLLHCIHFADAFKNKKEEIMLIYGEPVYQFSDKQKSEQAFGRQIPFEIKDPVITSNSLSGLDTKTGFDITIQLTTNEEHQKAAGEIREYLLGIKKGPHNFNPYLTFMMNEIADGLQKFRYKYYQSI